MTTNENPSMCSACGGKCCRECPGMWTPVDLGAPDPAALRARIEAGLRAGTMQLDWWEGDPRDEDDDLHRCLFVRAPVEDDDRVFSPTWGGRCALHTDTGCKLSFAERPTACRALEPCEGGCRQTLNKRATCVAWIPYQGLLEMAGRAAERRAA